MSGPGQGGCERRSEVFCENSKKKFSGGGGGGGGGIRSGVRVGGGGGGVARFEVGGTWWVMWGIGDLNQEYKALINVN